MQNARYKRSQVYPRVGGGNGVAQRAGGAHHGLSPRGRGKLTDTGNWGGAFGSIPAWAGETQTIAAWRECLTVYPRVGGGNLGVHGAPRIVGGLSPRGRGKPGITDGADTAGGSIPAWAGETTRQALTHSQGKVYPRVGGGNPCRLIVV